VAFGVALALGALHALAPGHGKTVMAAYLVGQRGSMRQALGIGATVAITHTIGVLALGIVLTVSQTVAPERLFPVLGAVSGLVLVAIGATLLRRVLRRPVRHGHHHGHHHGHQHHHHDEPAPMGWRSVIGMGLAGGLVPSPSALLVLLGAVALGRAWFGVILVVAYGLGMAATLVLVGLVLARARTRLERLLQGPRLAALATRVIPAAAASVITFLGLSLAIKSGVQL
jgi:ABC-type nickel/cobalt efflux system permease component RcnA